MTAVPESAARLSPEREAEITARAEAATKGPWSLAYEACDCCEDDDHGLYVSRINTGAGPATELADLPSGEWELMVHAREDVDLLLAELAAVRAERDAWRDQRNAVFATNERLLVQVDELGQARLHAENEARVALREAREKALREAADHFDRMADREPDQHGYRARVMRGAANDIRRLIEEPAR
ncbi:hypothetical protein ACFVOB_28115 [Streptomyces rochei]|uniref:hypothetical protein n=1 Tax=Streptomyces rochei TaxID=1928 RepID=UPI0036AF30CC